MGCAGFKKIHRGGEMNVILFVIFSSFIHNEILIPSDGFDLIGIHEISLFETSVQKFHNFEKDIFLFSISDWFLDSKNYHVTYYNSKFKTGLSISYFDFGKFDYYENASFEPIYSYKPYSLLAGVYHSFKIDPELYFNAGVKFINSTIWEYTSNNFLLDAFLFFNPRKMPFIIMEGGVRNFGTASRFNKRYYSEPFLAFLTAKANLKKFHFKFRYTRGLWDKEDFEQNFKFAVSYSGIKYVSLLAGISYPDDFGVFSMGIEIKLPFINLRYSYKPSGYFDDVHFIGITNAGI